MCTLSAYTLLIKVVSYYDLSVLSISQMGFQKKKVWMGGEVSSIQVFLDYWNFFNFPKPLTDTTGPEALLSPSRCPICMHAT